MTKLEKTFKVDVAEKKWWKIILWWEIRRPLYNLFLLLFLGVTLAIFSFLPNDRLLVFYPGPMLALGFYFGIILFIVFANVFYTSGWIFQLIMRNMNWKEINYLSNKAYILGLIMTAFITLAPVILGILNFIFSNK
jgi:hypothetical protein